MAKKSMKPEEAEKKLHKTPDKNTLKKRSAKEVRKAMYGNSGDEQEPPDMEQENV